MTAALFDAPGYAEPAPRNCLAMQKAALAAGWRTRITRITHADGVTDSHKSHVLRLRRGPQGAVAVWWAGKFRAAFTWSDLEPIVTVGARELTAHIKETP